MLANARQFMPVRIAQIGNIKIGAVGGSCTGHAFILSSRTEAHCMEASDNFRAIGSECEHCPVSRRRGLLVKRRTNAEAIRHPDDFRFPTLPSYQSRRADVNSPAR